MSGKSQVGTGTLFLPSGVIFSADGLVLIPSADITITGSNLTHDNIPIPGTTAGTNSIDRVYDWSTLITGYSGEIGILYQPSELAGNTESMLRIAYYDGTHWVTAPTGTVDLVLHYVNYQASDIDFNFVTATSAGVILPIIYAGFTAAVKDQYVALNWSMADVEGLASFDVEYSNDGRNWSVATNMTPAPAQRTFRYDHHDMNFSTRHYRIAGIGENGNKTYSTIATVRNSQASSNVRVVRQGNNAILYFQGKAPQAVQLYDMKGQLLQTRNVLQQQCEVSGLIPGTYVIFYIVDGQKLTRKIQL